MKLAVQRRQGAEAGPWLTAKIAAIAATGDHAGFERLSQVAERIDDLERALGH